MVVVVIQTRDVCIVLIWNNHTTSPEHPVGPNPFLTLRIVEVAQAYICPVGKQDWLLAPAAFSAISFLRSGGGAA
jgi:hypothetical protein